MVDADGRALELAAGSGTPLRLVLPPGRYTVTLESPEAEAPRQLEVEVEAGELNSVSETFLEADVDAFLAELGL